VLASGVFAYWRKIMPKGYWVTFYKKITNPDALAAYAKLAKPAIEAGGGKFIARGVPAKVYDAGVKERAVLIEFESVAQAVAAFESPAYQEARKLLAGAVERDVRIIEGTLPIPPVDEPTGVR
jgi:uncharacterized protein (DUF1330 family)